MFPTSSDEISKDASTPRRPLEAAIAMAEDSWEQRDTNDAFTTFAYMHWLCSPCDYVLTVRLSTLWPMQLLVQMPGYIYISRHAVETLRAHARPKLMDQFVRSQNLRLWKALQANPF